MNSQKGGASAEAGRREHASIGCRVAYEPCIKNANCQNLGDHFGQV